MDLEMTKQIYFLFGDIIPLGSTICPSCIKKHQFKLEENAEWFVLSSHHGQSQETKHQQESESSVPRIAKHLAEMKPAHAEPETPISSRKASQQKVDTSWIEQWQSDSSEEEEKESVLHSYNEAMITLAKQANVGEISPLTFQLKTSWGDATKYEKEICIDIATEACSVVCKVIAPNAANELLQSVAEPDVAKNISSELVALMQAHKRAATRNLKTQILSLYAYRFPIKKLQEVYEPYERLSKWQITRARAHARVYGPGFTIEKATYHRIRLPRAKVDHFVDFINRPYFYQDVAFGIRELKLDSGETLTMPNVIRKVTRSTMIQQYLQFCDEEQVTPLSRATMYRILEVREASQQKSLRGLDNTAAEGSASFDSILKIVEELEQMGLEKQRSASLRKDLQDGKCYFKTEYRNHCEQVESRCPDHCRKFSLSDPADPDLQASCTHQHDEQCCKCDNIVACLFNVEETIKHDKTVSWYSQEQQDDMIYDFKKAAESIHQWKAHIMRSAVQECAKQDVINELDCSSILIVMDWAMKFLQMRYREKQSDWFGKRGLSWHISSVVSRDKNTGSLKVTSYAHLFDQCTQDWFSVTSIVENLLHHLKTTNADLKKVYLRSDEAGCYHNSSLIAALKDIGDRIGIAVVRYDFSEPQFRKDICDRILCPMKSAIRQYCSEGNDILSASDMREALQAHPVKGTTVSVNVVNETQKNLSLNKIDHFSSFDDFQYEDTGVRIWKSYGIGKGKLILYKEIFLKRQGPTKLITKENKGFFLPTKQRELKPRRTPAEHRAQDNDDGEEHQSGEIFECSEPGCIMAFKCFSELEMHLNIGQHCRKEVQETMYDSIRREWATRFSSVDERKKASASASAAQAVHDADGRPGVHLKLGWAMNKQRTSHTHFSSVVREYLTAKFIMGERTGQKADPAQVSVEMRHARDKSNERKFKRNEWLSKTQVQSFFSRLAATRRKEKNMVQLSEEDDDDVKCLADSLEREELIQEVTNTIGLKHPIMYDVYDLCEYTHDNRLNEFNVAMLKTICSYFEIKFKSKDKKQELIDKLKEVISDCDCMQK